MTEAAQQFAQHVMAWKARSQAGQACGIVGCPQPELTPCTLGCGNSYCAEHRQVHFHAGPAQAHPITSPVTGLPVAIPPDVIPAAPLPRPPVPRLLLGERPELNDSECLLVLTAPIIASLTNPSTNTPPAFSADHLRAVLRYTADAYRTAFTSQADPTAAAKQLEAGWKTSPLDDMTPFQALAYHQINCVAGTIMRSAGAMNLVEILDYVTENEKFWAKLTGGLTTVMADLVAAGTDMDDSIDLIRGVRHKMEEEAAASAGMVDVVFSFDPTDTENWSIDMENVPKEQVALLAEALADAASDLMDPVDHDDERDPDGAEGDGSKELA